MPYTIDDFPIETSEAKIDVTLPVGRHVFDLVVEDDAGLRSTPDRVIITVQKEYVDEPVIAGISPSWALQGDKKVDAVIHGQNLIHVREVKFWRGTSEDSQITVTFDTQYVEGDKLSLNIAINDNAALGERSFTVTTIGGTAQSPPDLTFTVIGMPVVDDVRPDYSFVGDETEVHVQGDRLLVPGEDLSTHSVDFRHVDDDSAGLTVDFVAGESSEEELVLLVTVNDNAKPGSYRVRVKTPAGDVESSELFEVRARQ